VSEVDDIVQATLTDALAADQAPSDENELKRWVFGIARNKVVDYYRKNQREAPHEPSLADEIAAESAPLSARELLLWAEKELPDAGGAKSTLEWMLREGAGEKLEEIANEEQVPAPRVRQRVARLRRHFRERWAAAVAAVAVLALLLLGAAIWWRRHSEQIAPNIEREPAPGPTPDQRADDIRRLALEDCAKERWRACLDGLDRAKELDAQGDGAEVIQEARAAAERGLSPPPQAPEPESSSQQAPPPVKKQNAPKPAPVFDKKSAPPVDSMLDTPVPKTTQTVVTSDDAKVQSNVKVRTSAEVQQKIEMAPPAKYGKGAKPTYDVGKK
jgi:RNA polymerase sigma factor (sigma-70 family)